MSLFEHLVERALELTRPVEPVIDPSRLGPPTLGPSTTPGFEETLVEVPAGQPGAGRTTSVVVRPPAMSTAMSPVRESAASPGPTSVIVPRSDPRPMDSPRIASPIAATIASGPMLVEREGSSVIVERRVEQRVERTRELVGERELGIEPKPESAPLLERVLRVRSASPVEPSIESRVEARRSEPSMVVIEPRPTVAAPSLPVPMLGQEAPPRLATPATPMRRSEPSGVGQASSVPIASRLAPPDPGPTLRIEIGRVIVRAESPPPQRHEPAASARPMASLADYLAGRDRGER